MKILLTLASSGLLVVGLSACGNQTTDNRKAIELPDEHDMPDHVEVRDDDLSHTARHGGMVESAGTGHMEMVFNDGNLLIYLFDTADEPLAVDGVTDATAVIRGEGDEEETIALMPMGDHLMSAVPGNVDHFTVHIDLSVAGEDWSAHFSSDMHRESDFEK